MLNVDILITEHYYIKQGGILLNNERFFWVFKKVIIKN